jgi:LPXTG-motif cell wall-anchored protein
MSGGRPRTALGRRLVAAQPVTRPTAGPFANLDICYDQAAMDTNTLLIIIVVILLLGGGGVFLRGRR